MVDFPRVKHTFRMKQRSKLERSENRRRHSTTRKADPILLVYFNKVIHKSLLLKGLRPELVSLATMSGVLWVSHSPDVVSHKVLDVLLASVVDADMVTAVKDIESVEVSRIGFVNIELHNFFSVFWL